MIVKQSLSLYMRVDLGSADVGMTKHFLNGSNIGATHQQVRRKGVA